MICKKNMTVRAYLLLNTETEEPYSGQELADVMLQKRFMPVDEAMPGISFVFGFTGWDSVTDTTLADQHYPDFNNFVLAGYRFDRKRVPASTIKVAFEKKAENFIREWNDTHPEGQLKGLKKETRQNLLESVKNELMATVPFTVKEAGVFYDRSNGILFVTGASEKEAEHIYYSLAQSLPNAHTMAAQMDLAELAEIYVKDFTEIKEELDKLLSKSSMNMNQAYAEFLSYLWFTSETISSANYSALKTPDGQEYKLWLSDADLYAAVVNSSGKADDILCSKDGEHAYIRYAMWNTKRDVIKCKFDLENTGSSDTGIALNALNIVQFGVTLKDVPDQKTPQRDDCDAIILDYCGRLFGTIVKIASLFADYATARVSEARWKSTMAAKREWLEAYAPACEVEEVRRQEGREAK